MNVVSDKYVLIYLEAILLFFLLLSLIKTVIIRCRSRDRSRDISHYISRDRRRYRVRTFKATVTLTRDKESMNDLYILYGTLTVIYALAVQVSEAFKCYKVFLITINYFVMTYLFFFNTWFRNKLFSISKAMKTD